MSAPDAVMLFAAGFGTRMRPLTDTRPKPLIEVAGRPLFDHALDLARAVAPARIVANAHYKADMLARHLAGTEVALSRETPDILDTGGGLAAARPLLGSGPVWTLNTDAIWAGPNPLALLRDAWDPDRMDALLIGIPVDRALGRRGHGDFSADTAGRLSRGGDLISGGAQILSLETLEGIPDRVFSLNAIWDRVGAAGRLCGIAYPGRWCDVGHPQGIALAESLLADV
jgi:MurNAc alpha-1-phosphate uridylyltransferase